MDTDQVAITQLVARFDDAVNRRDAQEFASLWDQDAVWEIGDPMPMRVSGAQAIVEKWRAMIDGTQWLFRGSFAGVITTDGDTATGRWPCIETGTFANAMGYDNRALYEDDYVRRGEQWLFKQRRYVYLWLSTEKLPGGSVKHEPNR
jgi:ketosteroid isomerase-like protein